MMGRSAKSYFFEKVLVTNAGGRGKAIAKTEQGAVILLTDAVPGDVVDIQTGRKRKSYFQGRVVKFHKLSDKRTPVVCQHFKDCGGCKWQHMDYKYQLYYKEKEVLDHFKKMGNLQWQEKKNIVPSAKKYFYRNKMEFSFSDNRWLTFEEMESGQRVADKNALGFHVAGMWDKVLDIEQCYLQPDPSNEIRNEIKKIAIKNALSFYNHKMQTGLLRTLMIRTSTLNEVMLVIQFFENQSQKIKLLLEAIVQRFPKITSLQYLINSKANDTIYDQQVFLYYGRDFIEEQMEGLRFKISAKSFYQTNSEQAYTLYKIVREFANLTGEELVYDLYTGTGTIAQFIAKNAHKVVGIDSVPQSIADAQSNAQHNKIQNVDFFLGDMKIIFTKNFILQNGTPQVIITDPPREGMHPKVVGQLMKIAPQRIVYVSCNAATQARDLNLMKEKYKIVKTQAVDMFPQTHHVENVVLLEK